MKRSASYNGFSYGLPSRIEDLTIEHEIVRPAEFRAELLFQKCKEASKIRSTNGVDGFISSGFQRELDGLERRSDISSLTELSDASSESDAWHEEFLRLRRQESVNEKERERLVEEIKTLQLKLELEEDLRVNDKECMNVLRDHISNLEGKLQRSEQKIRELEHEKQRIEVSSAVLPASKPGEVALVKARLDASHATVKALESDLKKIKGEKTKLESQQKETKDSLIKLERQLSGANKELQRREILIGQLVEERRSLEDYQIRSRSLQRKDQKSSYALQIQVVNLQEKLEMSERANEELSSERKTLEDRINKLENAVRELQGSYRCKLLQALERVHFLRSQAEEETERSGLHNGYTLPHLEFSHDDTDLAPLLNSNGVVNLKNGKANDLCLKSHESEQRETVALSTLRNNATILLHCLTKQDVSKLSGTDLEYLKGALREFLCKSSNGDLEVGRKTSKFLEKPLRLGGVPTEPTHEETVWEKGPQTFSKDQKEKSTRIPVFTVQKVTREKFTSYCPDLKERRQNGFKSISTPKTAVFNKETST